MSTWQCTLSFQCFDFSGSYMIALFRCCWIDSNKFIITDDSLRKSFCYLLVFSEWKTTEKKQENSQTKNQSMVNPTQLWYKGKFWSTESIPVDVGKFIGEEKYTEQMYSINKTDFFRRNPVQIEHAIGAEFSHWLCSLCFVAVPTHKHLHAYTRKHIWFELYRILYYFVYHLCMSMCVSRARLHMRLLLQFNAQHFIS